MEELKGWYIFAPCDCGNHGVDLTDAMAWDEGNAFYNCNKCKRPLVVMDEVGRFYYIGPQITRTEGRR